MYLKQLKKIRKVDLVTFAEKNMGLMCAYRMLKIDLMKSITELSLRYEDGLNLIMDELHKIRERRTEYEAQQEAKLQKKIEKRNTVGFAPKTYEVHHEIELASPEEPTSLIVQGVPQIKGNMLFLEWLIGKEDPCSVAKKPQGDEAFDDLSASWCPNPFS